MDANAEPTRALDAHYYTDPGIFNRELKGLLSRTWQYAGHVCQVENPGDYFAFEVAGQGLFCLRDHQGEIRAYYNVCQHRAHELVSGTGNANYVVCPYHGWAYELTGQLRSGPNLKAIPGLRPKEISLSQVQVECLGGFIFVNLSPDAAPMDAWYPGVREELTAHVPHIHNLKPLEWVEIPEACNWKISIENYSECYHCRRNHPTFVSGVVKPATYDIRPQGYCLRHTTECQNLGQMSYAIDLAANDYAGVYSSWFLWPLFSFQVYPGNVLNTYHWRPTAVDQVVVWRGWYTVDGSDSEIISKLARQDRATTVEEDIHLVESVQRGLMNRGYRPGPLVIDPAGGLNSEHSIKVLHGWMREAIDG
ncbi:MAG: aromatic ring-hydroxylating dioxygenase subunit alpha [Candidatus Competibacterales bacterium]